MIQRLAAARIGSTFNQYAASAQLRERLADYLERRSEAELLLVGEAAGYRGARVSGIPFTSERQLTGSGPAEASATIVHRVLEELGLTEHVLLWNVVPTHPHRPGEPPSNRRPRADEIEASRPFLEQLAAGPAASSPWAGSPRRRSARPGSVTRRTAALRSSEPGWPRLSEQHLPIARNTATLAVIQALYSTVLQLGAAVLSLSFVLVTGFRSLLGAGPAIFLTASALAALPAGRAMDRFGRVPVIVVGFLLGSIGYSLAAVGTHWGSGVALITGFAFAGIAGAVTLLIRTAAGDMYPPERRARGISYVLFGSVFGAVLGPSLFGPLFAGKDVAADTLTVPWLAAAGLSLVTCGLALTVRPDTKVIAERIAPDRLTARQPKPLRFGRSCGGRA